MRSVLISVAVLVFSIVGAHAGSVSEAARTDAAPALRRSEPAVISDAVVVSRNVLPATRATPSPSITAPAWPSRVVSKRGDAHSSSPQSSAPQHSAPVEAPEISNVDRPDVSEFSDRGIDAPTVDLPFDAAPTSNAVDPGILRGHTSDAPQTRGGALHTERFSEFGKQAYTLPKGDGRIKLTGLAAQSVRPLLSPKRHRPLPITEVSIAVMALLSFILGRSLLRSMRRRRNSSPQPI